MANNLALGVQLNHTVTGGSVKSSNTTPAFIPPSPLSSSTLRVGPVVQYYKMLGEQFSLTGTLGAGYESDMPARQYTQYPNYYFSLQKSTGLHGALTPGIAFFPVPKFGLTATMGSLTYTRLNVKSTSPARPVTTRQMIRSACSVPASGLANCCLGARTISDVNKGGLLLL